MQAEQFTQLALSFPGTEQRPHFNRTGFRIAGKKMFTTLLETNHTANIFLTPREQQLFIRMHPGIYPVPNKWGEKGATTFELDHVPAEIVREALISAYQAVLNSQ